MTEKSESVISEELSPQEDEKVHILKDMNYNRVSERQVSVVYEILKRGKRIFGSSGASLTHQISNPAFKDKGINAGLAQVGMAGEHKTSKILREWAKDKKAVVIVDSVHLRGMGNEEEVDEETGAIEGGDTDHVLIIGNYVIIIDSKNWKGQRKYAVNPSGEIIRSNKPFPGGKVASRPALFLWKKYLEDFDAIYNSIICITSEKVFVVRDVNWWKQPFKVVTMEDLPGFLDKVWEQVSPDAKTFVNANLVASVVTNAIKPYDVVKEQLGPAAHLLDI